LEGIAEPSVIEPCCEAIEFKVYEGTLATREAADHDCWGRVVLFCSSTLLFIGVTSAQSSATGESHTPTFSFKGRCGGLLGIYAKGMSNSRVAFTWKTDDHKRKERGSLLCQPRGVWRRSKRNSENHKT